MKAPGASRTFLFFENLSIQVKAFAASAVLLICLISLGTIAYVTLDKSEDDLHKLSSTILPKQSAFALVSVIGTHKFAYDIWGDTVNIASRMESHSLPNHIQISAATERHLHEHFKLEPHGTVDVKGKGPMETFFLLGRGD